MCSFQFFLSLDSIEFWITKESCFVKWIVMAQNVEFQHGVIEFYGKEQISNNYVTDDKNSWILIIAQCLHYFKLRSAVCRLQIKSQMWNINESRIISFFCV
jgi:hypothetical protein